jgi:hypothetical protein
LQNGGAVDSIDTCSWLASGGLPRCFIHELLLGHEGGGDRQVASGGKQNGFSLRNLDAVGEIGELNRSPREFLFGFDTHPRYACEKKDDLTWLSFFLCTEFMPTPRYEPTTKPLASQLEPGKCLWNGGTVDSINSRLPRLCIFHACAGGEVDVTKRLAVANTDWRRGYSRRQGDAE